MSSAAPVNFTSALPSVSECTFSRYLASAHIETRSSVIVTLTIVEPDLVDSKQRFPAGSIANPSALITAFIEETVYLIIASQNQVYTEIGIMAKMMQYGYKVSSLLSDAGSWASPAN
jgi:hypothetical protein